jgi:hypothetical protein
LIGRLQGFVLGLSGCFPDNSLVLAKCLVKTPGVVVDIVFEALDCVDVNLVLGVRGVVAKDLHHLGKGLLA